ncbi:hypothetical protein Q7P36_011389 [Cladosporium allicinum]
MDLGVKERLAGLVALSPLSMSISTVPASTSALRSVSQSIKMVTTRSRKEQGSASAKRTEPTNNIIPLNSPSNNDDEGGTSEAIQLNSPAQDTTPPAAEVASAPNSPMQIDPATRFTDQETPNSPPKEDEDSGAGEGADESELYEPNSPMNLDPPPEPRLDTPTSPKADSPDHEDIAPDGDLIIQFSGKSTARVSSSTLSRTSAPLSATIKKWFSKRTTGRNAAVPMTKEMHEDDSYTLYRLLRLLHNRPDPGSAQYRLFDVQGLALRAAVEDGAGNLQQLAILIDKYQCHEALELAAESLLSEFAFPGAQDAMCLDQAVQVVTAAYLLQQARYFQLFTKRLATDYAVDWADGDLKLYTMDFPSEIPTKQASLMKAELGRQAHDAIDELDGEIQGYTFGRCFEHVDKCVDPRPKDPMVPRRITESINVPGKQWPPNWCARITLRYILARLYRLERVQRWLWCDHHLERTHDSVGPERFVQLCARVDRLILTGLCLACTKAHRVCVCEADSVPHAGSLRFVSRDSYLLGAGPTYEDESENSSTEVEGSSGMP